MEFNAREDINAPIDYVFQELTDFPTFERSIMRRGGDVTRLEGPQAPNLGARWEVKFHLRGKDRVVEAELVKVDPGSGLTVEVTSSNLDGGCVVELVPLSRSHTRIIVTVSANPKSIAAKLLFKSMRFGKHRMTQRFKKIVASFAEDVETRHRAAS